MIKKEVSQVYILTIFILGLMIGLAIGTYIAEIQSLKDEINSLKRAQMIKSLATEKELKPIGKAKDVFKEFFDKKYSEKNDKKEIIK